MAKRLNLGPEIERYTQILARDPNSLAFVPLADAYRKSGLYEEAFAVLKRGLANRSDYLPAQIVLGKCYLDLGNYPKAEATFRSVLRSDPDNLVALDCVALMRKRQRRLGEAATVYRRILELDPSNRAAREKLDKLEGQRPGSDEDVIELDLDSPAVEESEAYRATDEETTEIAAIDFDQVMREDEPSTESSAAADGGTAAQVPESAGREEVLDLREAAPEVDLHEDDLLPEPIEPERSNEVVDIEAEFGVAPEPVDDEPKPESGSGTEPREKADGDDELEVDVASAFAEDEYESPPAARASSAEPQEPETPVDEAEEEPPADRPVPPPPREEELPPEEPRTEVMEEEDVPPVQPPIKDELPPSRDEPSVPNLGAFTEWLSDIAERKQSQDDDKESDSGN
ncbi:MAG: tetratricopeptide repeat protein [Candidatus Coatesbacteria bacterium]|nr:tetratricopeptide repeat protein [Candidatus Coatesbacteria bacterium]